MEIIPVLVTRATALTGGQVIVRITASDDNSGLGTAQISHEADFATYESFPVSGMTTDVQWQLQPLGKVFVRVSDRAGNLSAVQSVQREVNWRVYLPAVRR